MTASLQQGQDSEVNSCPIGMPAKVDADTFHLPMADGTTACAHVAGER